MVEIEVEEKVFQCVWLRMLLKLRLYNNLKIYILILMVLNLNIVELITPITSWNKKYFI